MGQLVNTRDGGSKMEQINPDLVDGFNPNCSVVFVAIDDPDDPLNLPIYVGTAERAYMKLAPGNYFGTDDNSDDEVGIILVVEPGLSWVKYDLDHAHESAILWEKFCDRDS